MTRGTYRKVTAVATAVRLGVAAPRAARAGRDAQARALLFLEDQDAVTHFGATEPPEKRHTE